MALTQILVLADSDGTLLQDAVPPEAADARHNSAAGSVAVADVNRENTAVTVSASESFTGTETVGVAVLTNFFVPADVVPLTAPTTVGATGMSGSRL